MLRGYVRDSENERIDRKFIRACLRLARLRGRDEAIHHLHKEDR
jgi:hypothetical protein